MQTLLAQLLLSISISVPLVLHHDFFFIQSEVLSEIRESVDDFKVKMSKLLAEDPKLKMMQKVMTALLPYLDKSEPDLGELLTLASMAMETWLDTRSVDLPIFFHFQGLES